ncbi:MAG: hypothetical protein ACRD8Z_19270, partial [Nitrososphaeraceae archaeon]
MKRLLIVGLSALVLAACGNDETTQKEPAPNTETTTEPIEEVSKDTVISETPINKIVDIKPFKVTIESISLKNKSNLSEDELLDISSTTGEEIMDTD